MCVKKLKLLTLKNLYSEAVQISTGNTLCTSNMTILLYFFTADHETFEICYEIGFRVNMKCLRAFFAQIWPTKSGLNFCMIIFEISATYLHNKFLRIRNFHCNFLVIFWDKCSKYFQLCKQTTHDSHFWFKRNLT